MIIWKYISVSTTVAGKWDARGWSCPRSSESPWDRPPSDVTWLDAEKNSRGSPHEGKAELIWEIHAPQIKNRLSQKARGLSVGLVSFYGLCNFIN